MEHEDSGGGSLHGDDPQEPQLEKVEEQLTSQQHLQAIVEENEELNAQQAKEKEREGSMAQNGAVVETLLSSNEQPELSKEQMMRLLSYQTRLIVELERTVAQQQLQIRLLNWKTSGYYTSVFAGLVRHVGQVFAVKFSKTGDILATASQDKTILIWDTETRECIRRLRGHTAAVYSLDCEGDVLVSGSADRTIRTWRFSTGESLTTITGHKGTVYCVKLVGNILVSGSADRTINVWNVKTGELINTLVGHKGSVSSVQLCTQHQIMGTSNVLISAGFDASIKLWNIYTGECMRTLRGHQDFVTCIKYIASERLLVSASNDTTVRLWDLTPLTVANGDASNSSQQSSSQLQQTNKDEAGSGDSNGDTSNQRPRVTIGCRILTGHTSAVHTLQVEKSGVVLLSGGKDNTIKVWNVRTGEMVRELHGHTSPIHSIEMFDDTIVSASDDSVVRKWKMLFF
ncbi:Sulfur metabolite repression control protein [Balamuthia mandrillaris]